MVRGPVDDVQAAKQDHDQRGEDHRPTIPAEEAVLRRFGRRALAHRGTSWFVTTVLDVVDGGEQQSTDRSVGLRLPVAQARADRGWLLAGGSLPRPRPPAPRTQAGRRPTRAAR